VHYLEGTESGYEAVEEQIYDGDDGLGYYDDGAKRTLTDEQIAMFRHSEIHKILLQRRRRLEDGESLESILTPQPISISPEPAFDREAAASPAPSSGQGTPMSISSDDENKVQSGPVDKPKQQWTVNGPKTLARNARNRKKNRKNHRARKKEELKRNKQEQKQKELERDEESDEWDPWHQANGPDVQKDETVDLDY
jgi:hypothetical protein